MSKEAVADQIPDCELFETLGQGGAGVVYRGRQVWLDRPVAIKVLRDADNNSLVDVERFAREARLLASLSHPAIVGCYQAGVTEAQVAYIAMEYVAGPTLRHYVESHGPLSEARAVAVLSALADALRYAHENGIIHRDIKAENVLLEPSTKAEEAFPYLCKLADLGLARQQGGVAADALTLPGAVMGSPRAMAPEQYDNPDAVDHRTDIYALGCLGVFLVTGTDAFDGDTFTEIMRQKLMGGEPPNLQAVTNRELRDLLALTLAQRADDRPATYDELIERLAALTSLEATASHHRPQRRRPVGIIGVLTAAVVAVMIVATLVSGAMTEPMQDDGPAAAGEPEAVGVAAVLPEPTTLAAVTPEPASITPVPASIEAVADNPITPTAPAVPVGDLLVGLQDGLQAWDKSGASFASADDRNALVLARGTLRHPTPADPFTATLIVGSQADVPVGSATIGLDGVDGTTLLQITMQNLGAQWLWSVAVQGQERATELLPHQDTWALRLDRKTSGWVVTLDGRAVATGPESLTPAHLTIGHKPPDGGFGALAVERLQLDTVPADQ